MNNDRARLGDLRALSLSKAKVNPFTAPDRKLSGLKDALARLQFSFSPVTISLSVLRVLMKLLSHASAKKEDPTPQKKRLRFSDFALLLVVLK